MELQIIRIWQTFLNEYSIRFITKLLDELKTTEKTIFCGRCGVWKHHVVGVLTFSVLVYFTINPLV